MARTMDATHANGYDSVNGAHHGTQAGASGGTEPNSTQQVVAATDKEDKALLQLLQVLAGVSGVRSLIANDNGELQADKLGYSSKLVSKWYHHECEDGCCPDRWAEFDNVDDELADLEARTKKVPIIHRHEYSNKHWITSDFSIQDPAMREILRTVLTKYQDLDPDIINWTFEPPFMPLVHRWEQLKAHFGQLAPGSLKNAASALLAFLAPIIAPSVLSLAQTRSTGKVRFDDVWQIFPPGSTVKTRFYGVETICKVVKYQKREATRCDPPGWAVDMEYVDWNGETSGWRTTQLII